MHLFLWRNLDENKDPDQYAITAVNFGDRPSAAVAIAALQKTVDLDEKASQKAKNAIKNNSYMDDILESCPNLDEGLKLMKEIEDILKQGGFYMKEWITSQVDKIVFKGDQEEISTPKEIEKEKILGLEWERERDEFHFKAKLNFSIRKRKVRIQPDLKRSEVPENIPCILTKRQILAQVNGIFDPLGLISPFTAKAKILLPKLWGQDNKLGWDEEISVKSENKSGYLQLVDLEKAEKMWIMDAQAELKGDVERGRLKGLCPRFQDGIIVVGGRTERWMAATWNRESFILLPYNHRFSTLITEDIHRKIGHLGIAATIAAVRSKFWILKIQKLATKISKDCIPCKKKYKRLPGQAMSELPEERLKPAPAFASVGCEVQKQIRGKCFGVIFTCLVSHAVHVDISNSYSTDSFLQALRRFSSLRGWPRYIYSDRGSHVLQRN